MYLGYREQRERHTAEQVALDVYQGHIVDNNIEITFCISGNIWRDKWIFAQINTRSNSM